MSDLARARLVLSNGRPGRGWVASGALVIASLLVGAASSHVYWRWRVERQPQQAEAQNDSQQLRQGLEQSRLLQRVSDARSQELERQIDGLNRGLRECQEEVTFFRKARDGKH